RNRLPATPAHLPAECGRPEKYPAAQRGNASRLCKCRQEAGAAHPNCARGAGTFDLRQHAISRRAPSISDVVGRAPPDQGERVLRMRLSRRLLCVAWSAAALSALAPASHSQTASIARGQEIAERACAGCHVLTGTPGRKVEGIDVPSFASIAARPNQTSQRLQSFIMT